MVLGYPLGNRLGSGLKVSQGNVSANLEKINTGVTLIQTDAAVNLGNSGGPMLNRSGQVIGINSSKIVSATVEGIGFAVDVDELRLMMEETGHKRRGLCGVCK